MQATANANITPAINQLVPERAKYLLQIVVLLGLLYAANFSNIQTAFAKQESPTPKAPVANEVKQNTPEQQIAPYNLLVC